ncbi:MAG TPA: DUF5666 domain-containing protein [Candidatus Nanoarchaeia archaeon]|nr:hypothetical protein [uncultured archaeon]
MTKKLLATSLIMFSVLITPKLAFSQDFSENAQKRLEEIEAKAATASTTATSSATKKEGEVSFVEGTVAAINGTAFLVNTDEGSRLIYTTDNTKYFNIDPSGKKLIGFGDIKVGETIMVLGLSSQSNSGTARIIVRDTVKQITTFSVLGKVVEVKDPSLTLENLLSADLPALTLTTSTDTKIQSGEKTIALIDLKAGDRVVAAGTIDDKGNFVVKTILRIKTALQEPTATTSAQ